jgi:PAS domain S-box-containing protein
VDKMDKMADDDSKEKKLEELIRKLTEENIQLKDALFIKNSSEDERRKKDDIIEYEKKYYNLIDISPDPIVLLDLQGNFIEVNTKAAEYYGLKTNQEFLSRVKNISDLLDEKDIDQARSNFTKTIASKKTSMHEYKIKIPNKPALDVEINAIGIYDESERPEALICMIRDITNRKKTEDTLKLITNSMTDMVRMSDLNGVNMYVSPSHERILGYKLEEWIGKSGFEIIHPDDFERTINAFFEGIINKQPIKIEYRVKHADGHYIWLETLGKGIFDSSDNLKNIVMSSRDITNRIITEEKLKISEIEFIHAQKMEAVGILAGGVAHNMNNYLTTIQGNISIMLHSEEYNKKRLNDIERIITKASYLTRELLAFARGGKYDIKKIDLNKLIKSNLQLFSDSRKEYDLNMDLKKGLWKVDVDISQIEQVLMNLYINAAQAMPDGGKLDINTDNIILSEQNKFLELPPGRYVKISIKDYGIGMDDDIKKNIFIPFFTTKGEYGTGLGLASVYGIVKGHNGSIDVYSEKGQGSTFNIYIPASEKEEQKEHIIQENKVKNGIETILIIDDEKALNDVCSEMIEIIGYKTKKAYNGQEGIEIYKQEPTDLVILDMIMPGMNGTETFKRLKGINPSIKVILTSGYSINEEAQKILDNSCNSFMQKPYTLQTLSAKIKSVFEKTEEVYK